MSEEAKVSEKLGIKVEGQIISINRYSDDKAVIESSEQNLKKLIDNISKVTRDNGMWLKCEDQSDMVLWQCKTKIKT